MLALLVFGSLLSQMHGPMIKSNDLNYTQCIMLTFLHVGCKVVYTAEIQLQGNNSTNSLI